MTKVARNFFLIKKRYKLCNDKFWGFIAGLIIAHSHFFCKENWHRVGRQMMIFDTQHAIWGATECAQYPQYGKHATEKVCTDSVVVFGRYTDQGVEAFEMVGELSVADRPLNDQHI